MENKIQTIINSLKFSIGINSLYYLKKITYSKNQKVYYNNIKQFKINFYKYLIKKYPKAKHLYQNNINFINKNFGTIK